jgi:hypothetical protein
LGRGSARSRAWRESWRGRAAPESITTRRLRPPGAWRGRTGLFGRFPFEFPPFDSAISVLSSVEPSEGLIDPDRRPKRSCETALGNRPLEARQAVACVDAPAGLVPALDQLPVAGYEANEL